MESAIKLNLGCGNKYMHGWVNVDLGEVTKDVDSDIRKLPFPDSYADEILANHVIEHFYRWEVFDILTEWLRVLKPGGRLVVECPDLERVLNNMINGNPNPYMHIYGLYGDQAESDPLMQHKWCYVDRELEEIMENVGYAEVNIEPAQFHKREARDMRLTGVKNG